MTSQQIYDEVLSFAYKLSFRYNMSVKDIILFLGSSPNTWHDLRNQRLPQRGKLGLFIKLLTLYINENYEYKRKN